MERIFIRRLMLLIGEERFDMEARERELNNQHGERDEM